MKTKDVKIGSTYMCRIGEELAAVVVVGMRDGNPDSHWRDEKRTSFYVRREGEDRILPKRRSAAALREMPRRRVKVSNGGNPESLVETLLAADKREQAASLQSTDTFLDDVAACEGAELDLCDDA